MSSRWIEYFEANMDDIQQKANEGDILCINIISLGNLLADNPKNKSTNLSALKTMISEYQRLQTKKEKTQ